MEDILLSVTLLMSTPFGMYCLISLLVSSTVTKMKIKTTDYKVTALFCVIVTHRFEPTSKYVLLFIGGLALSLVFSIWGNLTQWREKIGKRQT